MRRRLQIFLNRRQPSKHKSTHAVSKLRTNSVASNHSEVNASSVLNYSNLKHIAHVPVGLKFDFKQNLITDSKKLYNSNRNVANTKHLGPITDTIVNNRISSKQSTFKKVYSFSSRKTT